MTSREDRKAQAEEAAKKHSEEFAFAIKQNVDLPESTMKTVLHTMRLGAEDYERMKGGKVK